MSLSVRLSTSVEENMAIEDKLLDSDRGFFQGICTADEVNRIFTPSNAFDYLLRMRAEPIVDSTRLFRVVLARMRAARTPWSLTNMFPQEDFHWYLSVLPQADRDACQVIPAGFVLSNDANGACIRSPFGDLVIVSLGLEHFLYFMNLAHLELGTEVPIHVRVAAQRIAIRTMLKTETLDFELDPRGSVPANLHAKLTRLTRSQLRFVIGHEYAHHFLQHLGTENIVDAPLYASLRGEPSVSFERHYNQSERDELEADVAAVQRPDLDEEERRQWVYAAMLWFTYLDIYQQVADQLLPHPSWKMRTHPAAVERLRNLFTRVGEPLGIPSALTEKLLERAAFFKMALLEDVAVNTETYEFYGSIYLDEPNSEWRGRELIDHMHF